jgi:integrase
MRLSEMLGLRRRDIDLERAITVGGDQLITW